MPIVRIGSSLVYYAHVPKCAGTSIEDYLIERFGPLALLNRNYRKVPISHRWSNTSPQHIDSVVLSEFFPENFFDISFTVVRHPVSRMLSAFGYHQARRLIPLRMGFEDWLHCHTSNRGTAPFQFDNHLRSMAELVPSGTHVFKLEDGLDAVIQWLDDLAGTSDGSREIPKSNKTDDVIWRSRTPWKEWIRSRIQAKKPSLDNSVCELVYSLYKEDYDRFGYDPVGPPPKQA